MNSFTDLQMLLIDSPIGTVLPAITQVNLPNWWLAGGAVRNTVWQKVNALSSKSLQRQRKRLS